MKSQLLKNYMKKQASRVYMAYSFEMNTFINSKKYTMASQFEDSK